MPLRGRLGPIVLNVGPSSFKRPFLEGAGAEGTQAPKKKSCRGSDLVVIVKVGGEALH
jgi:hypothetical protein